MRYAQIRDMDVSNGEGVGVSLFVQGCNFHCKNCFNPDTWGFNGGKEWTDETEKQFFKLIERPYIKRISLLGGECLCDANVKDIEDLLTSIVNKFNAKKTTKQIWLYTGYTWEDIYNGVSHHKGSPWHSSSDNFFNMYRWECLSLTDVLVDGQYVDELRDITLPFRGSSNQRIIDVQESAKQGQVVLWHHQ